MEERTRLRLNTEPLHIIHVIISKNKVKNEQHRRKKPKQYRTVRYSNSQVEKEYRRGQEAVMPYAMKDQNRDLIIGFFN